MDSSRKAQAPNEVSIKKATKGFIVRHSYDNASAGMSYRPSDEHGFTTHKEAMAHVHKTTKAWAGDDDADDLGKDQGAEEGTGKTPAVRKSPDKEAKPTGVAGKAKAKAPNQRTYGAGVD
jgi:hypothetical protein